VTHTLAGAQDWWQVDLGSSYQISSVKLWNRTDCCSERLSNFYVFVSDAPFSSTDLATTINQAGVSNYYTPGQAATTTTIAVSRTGRYVRVQLAGSNYLSLAEVQIMSGGGGAQWLVSDHLGTPRIVADQTGSLAGIRRHDYLPYGEELAAGVGGRTTAQGYAGDSVKQKFTGYERDAETALNFAEARYHSDVQGRFTSVDPLQASAKLTDPQSFNRYSYVSNKPTIISTQVALSY
jgi:RHS repeat-associated protein